jgi:hypothetical protein
LLAFAASLPVLLASGISSAQPAGAGAAAPRDPATATAPPSVGDSLTGEAKDAYDAARSLFLHDDYEGALVKFQRAFDLSSDVRLLWDEGACELNLKHYVRVLRLVERYLHDGDPRITEEQRAAAIAIVRKVRPLVSEVRLTVNEPGASVSVDGEPAGVTPLTDPLMLDLGDRHIRVSKPGFKDQVITQHVVGASDVTLTVGLQPEAHEGHLAVTTDAGAAIAIDGNAVGLGRWEGSLASGSHSLRVTAPGMRAYSNDFALREGETRTLEFSLTRDSGGISPWWWVGGGVVAAAGIGVGTYFAVRPSQTRGSATEGTIYPYTLTVR